MQLFTPTNFFPVSKKINYQSNILLLGSCFAENMADKLRYFQFNHWCNPWGILFHPLAIENMLDTVVNQRELVADDVFVHADVWSSFEVHSSMNALSREQLLKNIQLQNDLLLQRLPQLTHLAITLGTAWVYKNISTDNYVANCHKMPASAFEKQLLTVDQISQSLRNIVHLVREVNPDCQFIFTISPVRHIKDGMIENQRSKAHLVAGLHDFLDQFTADCCTYFPSYELMIDELRDYRFYTKDLLHPNDTAIEYIWQQFVDNVIDKDVVADMKKVDEVMKSLNHRPFNPNTTAHQQFLTRLQQKITTLQQKYPFMNFQNPEN